MMGIFRSLSVYNFRVWSIGALVSNVGTWMQRVAQDWLVLTQLTHNNARAMGVVMALQFGPQLLMLPWTGLAADRIDRRKLVIATQTALGLLALGLGIVTIGGVVTLWQVYGFAFLLGCVTAFDAPARQTFVNELVGETQLANAVGLNSTSFNAARMIGPAVAGLLIAAVGTGWVFVINAVSFAAVLVSLKLLRVDELHAGIRRGGKTGGVTEGFRYVWGRPDLIVIMVMLFVVGTFGLNFPIYISTMSVRVFHGGAGQYGLLTATLAVGSVIGALISAQRERPGMLLLSSSSALFGIGCLLAALAPDALFFGLALVLIGVSALTFIVSTNSFMQLTTEPAIRGRVIALRIAIIMGGTPVGAPIVGAVADHFGPRWALGGGVAAGLIAAIIGFVYIRRTHHQLVR